MGSKWRSFLCAWEVNSEESCMENMCSLLELLLRNLMKFFKRLGEVVLIFSYKNNIPLFNGLINNNFNF